LECLFPYRQKPCQRVASEALKPGVMEGYLLRAQGQDDARRRAQRCITAVAERTGDLVAQAETLPIRWVSSPLHEPCRPR
jgi:hypothetical protein